MSFVHLHNHTDYSMLDGHALLPALAAAAAAYGQPALAITDHGNLFGAYEFWKACKKVGVKPIIGIEAYLAPHSATEKTPVYWGTEEQRADDVSGAGAYTHLTLLAENAQGLRNLFALVARSSAEGFYYQPRMDLDMLAEHHAGLIATTGCPGSAVQTLIRLGQAPAAANYAGKLQDIFGETNLFLELMDHGLEVERRTLPALLQIGSALSIPPVLTNDLHYTLAEHAGAHELLLAVQSGKTIDDPKRFKFEGAEYYLKSGEQMRALQVAQQVPRAADNTLLIAEAVGSYDDVFAPRDLLPRFPVPHGMTEADMLRREASEGLARRFGGSSGVGPPSRYLGQLNYELSMLEVMGFCGYMLIVADVCNWAREQGIRIGPGRGSAAASLVAWAIGITEIEPIAHGLLFERFINPERVSMPDIDLDVDERRRGELLSYMTQRYGREHVGQIVTYNRIGAKAAIKDATRSLGYPYALGESLSEAFPAPIMGKQTPLAAIYDTEHPRHAETSAIRELMAAQPEALSVIAAAGGLESRTRQWGVHAAGVVMSSVPLAEVVPMMTRNSDSVRLTQLDMRAVEEMGLLKMDFLGLSNLTIIEDCLTQLRLTGIRLVLEHLPLTDPATFRLLAAGDTLGVFQLDSPPIRRLLRSVVPTRFEDIAAVLALYRPGPMGANAHNDYADRKNGRKPIEPIHPQLGPALADILAETYGVIVYQEQVMAIVQRVAGYSLGKADLLRRAMGKKKKEILDAEYEPFAAGMRASGYAQEAIDALWKVLIPFSDYAFAKPHTTAYGLISYWTAYLKANHPTEYMAALLSNEDTKEKVAEYLAECRKMGIVVLPPSVSRSDANFTAQTDGSLRYGLRGVAGVGAPAVEGIIAGRPYDDLDDFLARAGAAATSKKILPALAAGGALDSFGFPRRELELWADGMAERAADARRMTLLGLPDLLAGARLAPPESSRQAAEWPLQELLRREKEVLGRYVSAHPLTAYGPAETVTLASLSDAKDGEAVTVTGVVAAVSRKLTKAGGRPWAIVTLEDQDTSIEVLVFSKVYPLVMEQLSTDAVLWVNACVSRRDGATVLFADDVRTRVLQEV